MTPEQIAAHCIAGAVLSGEIGLDDPRSNWRAPARLAIGQDAVERMSAAGLVLVTAERAAALLEIERRAQMTQSERIEGTHA